MLIHVWNVLEAVEEATGVEVSLEFEADINTIKITGLEFMLDEEPVERECYLVYRHTSDREKMIKDICGVVSDAVAKEMEYREYKHGRTISKEFPIPDPGFIPSLGSVLADERREGSVSVGGSKPSSPTSLEHPVVFFPDPRYTDPYPAGTGFFQSRDPTIAFTHGGRGYTWSEADRAITSGDIPREQVKLNKLYA